MQKQATAVIAVMAFLAAALAHAAPITVKIEGEQRSFSDPDGRLPFTDSGLGTRWSLTFTYESDTVDNLGPDNPFNFPVNPVAGVFSNAISDITLEVDSQSFGKLMGFSSILVVNDNSVDGVVVDQWLANSSASEGVGAFDPLLLDFPQRLETAFGYSAFSTAATAPFGPLDSKLLNPPPAPSAWEDNFMFFSITLRDSVTNEIVTLARAEADVTSISVVPLPAAFWLFASALAGLLLRPRATRKA